MILYKRAGLGLPVRTEQGNLTELQGNDSLSTASGQASHAARGFGPSTGYSVIGDTMNNGKRSLHFKYNGSGPQLGGVNRKDLMAQAQSDYLSRNPTSTNTTAPNAMDEYIASRRRAPLPVPAPKKPLMSQDAWKDSQMQRKRNDANAIAPVRSQAMGIPQSNMAAPRLMGLDGKPQRKRIEKVTF